MKVECNLERAERTQLPLWRPEKFLRNEANFVLTCCWR